MVIVGEGVIEGVCDGVCEGCLVAVGEEMTGEALFVQELIPVAQMKTKRMISIQGKELVEDNGIFFSFILIVKN